MRIIGGALRRRRLHFPSRPGLRPTPDRVRETLFNWLGQDLTGWQCLDLFAGSGALGFEAASRGADRVVMVDLDRAVVDALRQQAQQWEVAQVEIHQAEAVAYLSRAPGPFDLVFLDPPFGTRLLAEVLGMMATRLAPGGRIYAESPTPLEVAGWRVLRQTRAGLSHAYLLELA